MRQKFYIHGLSSLLSGPRAFLTSFYSSTYSMDTFLKSKINVCSNLNANLKCYFKSPHFATNSAQNSLKIDLWSKSALRIVSNLILSLK